MSANTETAGAAPDSPPRATRISATNAMPTTAVVTSTYKIAHSGMMLMSTAAIAGAAIILIDWIVPLIEFTRSSFSSGVI